MTETLRIPSYVPRVLIPQTVHTSIAPLIEAVTAAGLWVNDTYEAWCAARRKNKDVYELAEHKEGKDLVSRLDRTSEEIMAHFLRKTGFTGSIFGEEHGVTFPNQDGKRIKLVGAGGLIALLDGVDGTEHLLKQTRGPESPYGTFCGIVEESPEGVLRPAAGAAYLPRQRQGFAASVKNGIAITYKITNTRGGAHISGSALEPFSQDRKDFIYNLGFFPTKPGQELPEWFKNVQQHGTRPECFGEQRSLVNTIGPESLAYLVDNYSAGREAGVGPSVVVMGGPMLHDIAAFAPVITILGGVIGDENGNLLGRDAAFVPPLVHGGRTLDTVAKIIKAEILHKTSLGLVILAQNEGLYKTALNYVKGFP